MMDFLKGILVVLLVIAVVIIGVLGVLLSAIVGVIVHAAMLGAPFILAVILAVRDWWFMRQWKKSQRDRK